MVFSTDSLHREKNYNGRHCEMAIINASRNEALGFAYRTRKNLEYIEQAFASGADVHVVTQMANSLLGLVVFPWERHFIQHINKLSLAHLEAKGWPTWEMTRGSCETLGQLLRYLRNSVAHGHIIFSSDSRNLEQVTFEVSNFTPKSQLPNWSARINAIQLRDFCLRLIDLLDQTIG